MKSFIFFNVPIALILTNLGKRAEKLAMRYCPLHISFIQKYFSQQTVIAGENNFYFYIANTLN